MRNVADGASPSGASLELWGGLECTVNRVGSRYFDQVELTGHSTRVADLDLVASLGIKTLRYPLLWERTAPSSPSRADWTWSDERLEYLARKEITPIVGLVHHGSGPRHTSLLDFRFAEKLADYADHVASRYPGLKFVTPINEPLTTARFSTLYGHWYPHTKSWGHFVTAILNQCIATRAAMKAMRAHIGDLQLVQTEDVGRVCSTPRISYQAEFENERRWLTFDLLSGRVDENHPMWPHLALDDSLGSDLESLVDDPCPPDIIGINYYVTSDRFLDERTELYPEYRIGGNGRDRYADVESVRAHGDGITGHAAIIGETWNRYRTPIAVTEVHLGCTREHQLRWLNEAWTGALEARARGCDVRAVTAWALFGSFGWDTLVTREPMRYECGAFDIQSKVPRETALAQMIRRITSGDKKRHPVIDRDGWWRDDTRLCNAAPTGSPLKSSVCRFNPAPVLVAGARGTLGSAFVRVCLERGIEVRGLGRDEMDITDRAQIRQVIDRLKPWAIVNAAGYVRVDDAESDRTVCYRANAFAPGILADECARAGIQLVTFSSDLVFDGAKAAPYVESDRVSPLGAYGASKAAGEVRVLSLHPETLVIRTSAFVGPWDDWNFATVALRSLSAGIPFNAANDSVVSPTYVPDLVNATLDLLIDAECGIWHLANAGAVTWYDLAQEVARIAALPASLVKPVATHELGLSARRPRYSVLGSEKASLLPTLDDALSRWSSSIDTSRAHATFALQQ